VAVRFLEMVQTGRWLQVRREIDQPDGSVLENVHAFPIETLAMRAGELGIPVTDTERLLDVVTYESLPEYEQPGDEPGVSVLITEADLGAGQRKHLDRVAAVKAAHDGRAPRQNGVMKRAADDRTATVRAAIVQASDLDPELAELAGELLRRQIPAARQQLAAQRASTAALAAVEKAKDGNGTSTLKAQLRARLAPGPTPPGRL
jgi:hypothetical protein